MFSGCGLIKHQVMDRQEYKSNSELEVAQQTLTEIKELEIIRVMDTSDRFYQLEIKPIGPFTFSVDSGFSGTAAYIKFSGRDASLRKALLIKKTDTKVLNEAAAKMKNQDSQIKVTKETKVGKINAVWLVVIVVIVLLLFRVVFKY